jgi:predicted HTH domain antitoxin
METLTIPVPEYLIEAAAMDKNTMIGLMRSDLACRLFQEGKFSLAQGAEFCGMNIYEFLDVLAAAGIPVINYSPEELKEEVALLLKKA